MSETSQPSPPPARCLVDTDVLSYVVRGDTRAEPYRAYLAGKEIGVSFQTVAELRRWGRTHLWGPSRWQQLQQVLARITVYLVDDALIDAWAYITAGVIWSYSVLTALLVGTINRWRERRQPAANAAPATDDPGATRR